MSKKLSVFFLHNVVSPYRLPVFEEINKSVDLDVNFCIGRTSDRKWNIDLHGYSFKYRILKSWRIGPFIVNPNLLSVLLQTSHDVYLVGDFPETAVSTFITVLVAKLRRKPVVLWSETIDNKVIYYQNLAISPKTSHRWLLAMLTGVITTYRKLLLGAPTTVAALSRNAYDFLLSQNVPASKIISGIQVYPSELLAASDTQKSDSPYAGNTVLLYLGYFNALKGIDDLIAAVKQISDTNIRLLIVGDGPQKQQLRDLAREDSRIQFIGYTEGTAKANLMSWADLFILPTLADCVR